jgi:3-methyladenine DNA glycosylase AlkD
MPLVTELELAFKPLKNVEIAILQKKYMKDKFDFYGVVTTERRSVFKSIFKKYAKISNSEFEKIVKQLIEHQMRDMHYAAIEFSEMYWKKNIQKEDIKLLQYLIETNSWWDSVDTLATHHLGYYLKKYPEQIPNTVNSFIKTENMWLIRSCILFQLKYKKETNSALMFQLCTDYAYSKEFFLQKAIGWALREYSKTTPIAVINFVNITDLKPLSKREALRLL